MPGMVPNRLIDGCRIGPGECPPRAQARFAECAGSGRSADIMVIGRCNSLVLPDGGLRGPSAALAFAVAAGAPDAA